MAAKQRYGTPEWCRHIPNHSLSASGKMEHTAAYRLQRKVGRRVCRARKTLVRLPLLREEMTKLFRCSGVACRRRGYHASGVLSVRPSARSTVKVSSSIRTALIFSPALGSEVAIPRLYKLFAVLQRDSLDCTQLA